MTAINTATELFNVRGMVAVITGGGSGLGAYAARALDANGAEAVYIVGRRQESLESVAKTAKNGSVKPLVGDVTSIETLEKIANHVRQQYGFLNLLFCNAGVLGANVSKALPNLLGKPTVEEYKKAVLTTSMDEFTLPYHTNVTAVMYTTASFLDLLDAGNKKRNLAQDSQVLVTTSISGFSRVTSAGPSYSCSKAATTHLVKTLSTSFARNGYHIRVNTIAPGVYPSEMTEDQTSSLDKFSGVAGHDGVFTGAHMLPPERSPAGRTGSEQDFAGAVLFLVSQAGSFVNGEALVTDGGTLVQLPSVY